MFSQGQFNGWVGQKYDILKQHADADTTRAKAEAGLNNANTGEVAANAASLRGLQGAEGTNLGASAAHTRADTGEIPANAAATRFRDYGSGNLSNAGAAEGFHSAAPMSDQLGGILQQQQQQGWNPAGLRPPKPLGDLNAPNPESGLDTGDSGYSRGSPNISTAHDPQRGASIMAASSYAGGGMVPGRPNPSVTGTPASDQIPAMLAPREAVLNEHGANLIGRDKIAAANAIGNHMAAQGRAQAGPPTAGAKMGKGMIPPKGKAGQRAPMGHAEGTSFVQPQDNVAGGSFDGAHCAPELREPAHYAAGSSFVQPQDNVATQPAEKSHKAPALKPMNTAKPQDFAKGTHMVGHGSSAKTPTKVDPAAIVSLMSALHQPGAAGPAGSPGPMMGGGQVAGLCRGGMV